MATAMVLTITGTTVAQAAPPGKPDSGVGAPQEFADEYTHIVVDKRPRGEADLDELRESLHRNGLQTAKSRWAAEGKDVEAELRKAGSGYAKNGHHEHVFMWDSSKKGIEGGNAIERNGDAIRVKIRWDALKKDGRFLGGTLKGDHGGGPLGGESTNGAWAHKGDIPRKYLFIVGVDDPAHPGMSQWLAGKGWPDGNGVCSTGGSPGRAKRSVNVCEQGRTEEAGPAEEGKPSGEVLESAEARQVEQVFGELAGKYGLKVVAPDGKQLSPSDIHARIRGYGKLSPEAKAKIRANLKSAGSTAKGALLVAGGVLWAKGVYDAFADDTTSLDKAAAITAIVPFVGCGTQAGAAAGHGRFDADDTAACFGADALLVTPLWPAGLTLHGARYFTDKWKEAQIPSITVFQQARDEAWKKTLDDFRASADGLRKLVKTAADIERQQLEAEKAVILHNAAEKTVEVDKGGASAEAKKLLKWSTERTAREQIKELPRKLREQSDTAIRDALVERARQYNEEFIKQEVNIDRWKDESWQAALHGPSHSRADRQEYLDKLIQRLRDRDMLPPVPDASDLATDIDRARKALAQQDA
ncbi:hypothetical protein K6I34_002478 [Streptomyces sp. UNOC14_S4]|nr:hypothetical protein [Streptomyces sp. UNOC14_S4]